MTGHVTWLVPVRIDTDGSLLTLCPGQDEGWLQVHFWALRCADCGTVVSEPVPGTVGVQHVEDLPHEAEEYEYIYGRMHDHAVEAGFPVDLPLRVSQTFRRSLTRKAERATDAS